MTSRQIQMLFILACGAMQACLSGKSNYEAIRVRGSDSEVNLVQALAESFMDRDSLASVGVTGGGSGAGIAALINHKTDLANSSRTITEEEQYYARRRGVRPFPITFAYDALAIIVHADNPVDSLSLEEISRLYSGKTGNWSQAGGSTMPVTLYGRQSSSGTFLYFREHVVRAEYSRRMIGMSGTAQIVEAVKADPGGIGYVSAGYLTQDVMRGIRVISVKTTPQHPACSPLDEEAITQHRYPITRPLLQYSDGPPTGKLKQFIAFQFSAEGQALIRKSGFYPVTADTTLHSHPNRT